MRTVFIGNDGQGRPTWQVVDDYGHLHKTLKQEDFEGHHWGRHDASGARKYGRWNDALGGFVLYDARTGRSESEPFPDVDSLFQMHGVIADSTGSKKGETKNAADQNA